MALLLIYGKNTANIFICKLSAHIFVCKMYALTFVNKKAVQPDDPVKYHLYNLYICLPTINIIIITVPIAQPPTSSRNCSHRVSCFSTG